MKVVQINTTCGTGSTGKICAGISKLLTENHIENYILYSYGNNDYPLGIKFSYERYIKLQALKSHLLGNYGFNSKRATKKLLSELDRINPDIVHLHNIHSHDCNLDMLLSYLKDKKKRVIWTFHDCWAFTGYCPYFDMAACDKWKSECGHCPQKNNYSFFLDNSKKLYQRKKELFVGLDLSIVTPSRWLADNVKESFLKGFPVNVIRNGIDLNVFKPTESDVRKKYGIAPHKHIILGVAFNWEKRKGLDVFIELADKLNSDMYQIVLVGTDDAVDKQLPKSIVSIHKTDSQKELVALYSAADVFVNPTREENYPTVNMEALACGTPVVTFNTGGSPEIFDETCGFVVDKDDIYSLAVNVKKICEEFVFLKDDCLKKSSHFEMNDCFYEYLVMYRRLIVDWNFND